LARDTRDGGGRSPHPGIVAFEEGPGTQGGLAAPLQVRNNRIGTLIVARRSDEPFSAEDIRLLRACAAQASVLLDRSLLYEEVAAGAIMEERSRLAREIHDGLAQHLAFLKMRVAWLRRSPATIDARQLQDIEGVLGTALAEARQAITTLRSEPGTTTTVDAISSYAADFGRISGLEVHVETEDGTPDVGPRARVELLRIVQEALNNVRKHAGASRVDVALRRWAEGLEVRVRDNGQGFEPNAAPAGHFGLEIMRERAESIGGTLDISSQGGAGTQVVVWVPASGEDSNWRGVSV
jgi:two-component system nitrate/nitrite sensor histidine kinase NarX